MSPAPPEAALLGLAGYERQTIELIARLGRLMPPERVAAWLDTPLPALDGANPRDCISHGRHERVARLVSGLEDSGFM